MPTGDMPFLGSFMLEQYFLESWDMPWECERQDDWSMYFSKLWC